MGGDDASARGRGEMFLDARGDGRAMRLSWHPEADIVVLSLWRESTCAGTFRMPQGDVGAFIDALVDGLRDAPGVHLPPRTDASSDEADVTETAQPFTDWAFGPAEGRATAS